VLVNGEVLSRGGKIAIPAIRRRVEALGVSVKRIPGLERGVCE
jgi:hypothetical protein